VPFAATGRSDASLVERAGHVTQHYCAGAADRLNDWKQSSHELIGSRALNIASQFAGVRDVSRVAQARTAGLLCRATAASHAPSATKRAGRTYAYMNGCRSAWQQPNIQYFQATAFQIGTSGVRALDHPVPSAIVSPAGAAWIEESPSG
jgi:hypothetical protein